jgi:hypothetical protein
MGARNTLHKKDPEPLIYNVDNPHLYLRKFRHIADVAYLFGRIALPKLLKK